MNDINIYFITVFRITAVTGYNIRLPVSGDHNDLCSLHSVR